MKSFILAAGALALSTAAVVAQPLSSQVEDGYAAAPIAEPAFGERSLPTSYQAIDAGSVAPGFGAQNDTEANDVTPNLGAGSSQSSNANNG